MIPHVRKGDIVSIQGCDDPYPSVGRIVEVIQSSNPTCSESKVLLNPSTDCMPYWITIYEQTKVTVLHIGETYRLTAGLHQGEEARFSHLQLKAPIAQVVLRDGSEQYCPASILETLELETKEEIHER